MGIRSNKEDSDDDADAIKEDLASKTEEAKKLQTLVDQLNGGSRELLRCFRGWDGWAHVNLRGIVGRGGVRGCALCLVAGTRGSAECTTRAVDPPSDVHGGIVAQISSVTARPISPRTPTTAASVSSAVSARAPRHCGAGAGASARAPRPCAVAAQAACSGGGRSVAMEARTTTLMAGWQGAAAPRVRATVARRCCRTTAPTQIPRDTPRRHCPPWADRQGGFPDRHEGIPACTFACTTNQHPVFYVMFYFKRKRSITSPTRMHSK